MRNIENDDDNTEREQIPNICAVISNGGRRLCQPAAITNKLPIIKWLLDYRLSYLPQDFIAGFTVGLTTIPQAIAYGVVAGLEPQYGLYSAFMGCFTYIFFGSCKDVTIATTAIMAIMVNQYATLSPDYAVIICFLVGCIILLFGLLNLGVLVRFISIPIITGFTIAAATTIASAQINNLFGMKSPSNNLIISWKHFLTHLGAVRFNDAALGVSSLVFLLLLKQVKDFRIGSAIFWKYLALARNALIVIIGTVLAYVLTDERGTPFRVTGNITAGLPPFRLPPFNPLVDGAQISFGQVLETVGGSLSATSLIAILEIVAISKAFSKGKIVNASQEMIALGMCNIAGSFFSSMPVTGSFTRTAVNNASGVRTPLGGAVTGSLVLLALAFLTETFYYIPKATLASIIIAAMLSLVELHKIADIWRSKKLDLLPFLLTLIPCLFWSLEYGILCGIAGNALFILHSSACPHIETKREYLYDINVLIADVKQKLDYASAEYLREKIVRVVNNDEHAITLAVIKGQQINSIDYTVAMNIITLKEDLDTLHCGLILWQWNKSSADVIRRLEPKLRPIFKSNDSLPAIVFEYCESKTNTATSSITTIAASVISE